MSWGIDTASDDHVAAIQIAWNAWGKPDFVGLYLPDYPTNAGVINWCIGNGIAVFAIYNGNRALGTGDGTAYANHACDLWEAMGLPKGCMIIMDIEQADYADPSTVHDFLVQVVKRGYVGGMYCNPMYGNNHSAAWQGARGRGATGVIYTSQNELEVNSSAPVKTFRLGAGRGNGAEPVPGFEGDVVLWQTWENNFNGALDLDCASDRGLALMWSARPTPPPTVKPKGHAIGSPANGCDLKTEPSHSKGRVAIDPKGRQVHLELGAVVLPTGKTATVNGEKWAEVHLPVGPVHGYVPSACIEVT